MSQRILHIFDVHCGIPLTSNVNGIRPAFYKGSQKPTPFHINYKYILLEKLQQVIENFVAQVGNDRAVLAIFVNSNSAINSWNIHSSIFDMPRPPNSVIFVVNVGIKQFRLRVQQNIHTVNVVGFHEATYSGRRGDRYFAGRQRVINAGGVPYNVYHPDPDKQAVGPFRTLLESPLFPIFILNSLFEYSMYFPFLRP